MKTQCLKCMIKLWNRFSCTNHFDIHVLDCLSFTSQHQYVSSPYSSLYIPYSAEKETFLNNQARLVGDHFLYSHCLNVWLRADVLKRNWMLLKLMGWRVKWSVPQALVLLHWSELEQNSRTWLIITSPIRALIGQLTRHACVSGQFASCTRAVFAHFADFFYENVWPMSSLFLRFVILLITRDKQIGPLLRSCLILSVFCTITDRIGFHSVLICVNYTGGTMCTQLLLKCQWWYINFFLLLGCDIYF